MGKLKRNPLITHRSAKFGNNFIVQRSVKNGEMLIFESELEYLVFLKFDTDGSIARIDMHPMLADIISFDIDEEAPNGYLDMKLTYDNGYVKYVEIKYAADLDESNDSKLAQRSRRQVELQRSICEEKDIDYMVITDEDLRPGTDYVENLKCIEKNLLMSAENAAVIDAQSGPVLDVIKMEDSITIGELKMQFEEHMLWDCIYRLFYRKEIQMDLDKTISYETEVWA